MTLADKIIGQIDEIGQLRSDRADLRAALRTIADHPDTDSATAAYAKSALERSLRQGH